MQSLIKNFSLCIFVINLIFYIERVDGVEKEIFSSSMYNEATIYDFVENDLFFEIVYPKELSYTYRLRRAGNFGAAFRQQIRNIRLVVADPPECCSSPYNVHQIKGSVVLVTRGQCSFLSKAIKAEESGAVAVIIMDNDIENIERYVEMVDDNTGRETLIPAAFLLGSSGYMIQRRLSELHEESAVINIPVNMTSVAINKLNQPPWIVW